MPSGDGDGLVARQETGGHNHVVMRGGQHLEALRADLPFDPFEFMDWEPPWEDQRTNTFD